MSTPRDPEHDDATPREPVDQGPARAEDAGGAHAAPRPAPPSGRQQPTGGEDTVVEDLRTGERTPRHDADDAVERGYGGPGTTAPDTTGAAAATAAPAGDSRRDRARTVDVEQPSRPGFGRHVLGVVVGFVLTPFAFLLTGIGGARLADIAGTSRMGTDTLGVVLLAIGVLLLAVLVLLGAWSPAVPITGGLIWGLALGTAYLVAPRQIEDSVADIGGGNIPAALDQFAQSAMSGLLLLVGVLLLAAGIATAAARRAGRRYGAAASDWARVGSGRRTDV